MFISTPTFLVSKFPQAVALVEHEDNGKNKIQIVMIKHSNAELEVLKSFPNRGEKKILSSEVGATRKQCKFRVCLPHTTNTPNLKLGIFNCKNCRNYMIVVIIENLFILAT